MTEMNGKKGRKTKLSQKEAILRVALLTGFGIAALLIGYLTFVAVRDFISHWQLTNLPGVSVLDATPTPGPEGAEPVNSLTVPLDTGLGPTPPPWDG
jgi:hypothetical protein